MGTQNNGIRRAAFRNQLFPAGLDLHRSEITRALGVWKAASAATFRAGQPVMLNANGEVALFDAAAGSTMIGVAKWSKVTLGRSVVLDQSVIFGASNATKNLKPNLVSGSVVVRSAVEGAGTVYVEGTDYSLVLANGTITHIETGGSIVEANPVYVSYTWSLTEEDYALEGKNFWQSNDYVSIQDGRIAVVQAPAQIFTTEFDTSKAYALTGATSNVYANSSGLFTSSSGGGAKLVGKVISTPTAGDPFLGIELVGQVAANS